MGCASSVQTIALDQNKPDPMDPAQGDKAAPSQEELGLKLEERVPSALLVGLTPGASTALPAPPVPLPNQIADDDEQNLYVPPMSPQKLELVLKWLDSLPPPEELARDATENPTLSDMTDGMSSEQSSAPSREGRDERKSSLTAEHLKQHTRVMSIKGHVTPIAPRVASTTQETSNLELLTGGMNASPMSTPQPSSVFVSPTPA